jgi:hypothetical protein
MAATEQGCLQLVCALIDAGADIRGGLSAAKAGKKGATASYLEEIYREKSMHFEE